MTGITRKGAWAGLSFWAALAAAAIFRGQYNLHLLLGAAAMVIASLLVSADLRKRVIFCTVFFMLGLGVNSFYTARVYEPLCRMDGEIVTVTGYISDRSQYNDDMDRVTVLCRVDGIKTTVSFLMPYDEYDYGREITVTGQVTRIADNIRFPSDEYYYSRGIFLQGGRTDDYVLGDCIVRPVMAAFRQYRDYISGRIERIIPTEEGAFLSAMLCGDKRELSTVTKDAMYRTGLGHIMTVSGTHLAVTSAFFGAVLSLFIVRRRVRYVLILIEIWGFALFSGFSVPVVRAAIMVTLANSGYLFGRQSDCANSLGLCAIALTLGDPYSAISNSFVFSFLSVIAAGVIAPKLPQLKTDSRVIGAVYDSFRISVAVMLLNAPASVWFSGKVSVLAVFTNILFIPFCVLALQLCSICLFTGGIAVIAYPVLIAAYLLVKPVLFLTAKAALLSYCCVFTYHTVIALVVCGSALLPMAAGIRYKSSKSFVASCIGVVCLWFMTSNIIRLLDDRPRLIVMPGKYSSVCIYIRKGEAEFFDLGSSGWMDSTAERCMELIGAERITSAFVLEDGGAAAVCYNNDLLLCPDICFVSDEEPVSGRTGKCRMEYFPVGETVIFSDMTVISEEDGFGLELNLGRVALKKNGFFVDESFYETSGETYPLEIDLESGEVRRLSYAYN